MNPRAGGLKNSIIQRAKRMLARALDWHVREQVEFNRGVMACVESTIETLNECKQALSMIAGQSAELRGEARELRDIRDHWAEWRTGWEQKLAHTEIQFLRSVSELQAAFQHRVTLMDANYREQMKAQHADFERSMAHQSGEIQQRFWNDLALVRAEYERLIHSELRLLRQRASLAREVEQISQSAPPEFANVDWLKFAERFRGAEDDIRARQQMYATRFREHAPVLDIGCGRGEMLQVFRDAGITARGIDSNDDSIALCQAKGLEAEKGRSIRIFKRAAGCVPGRRNLLPGGGAFAAGAIAGDDPAGPCEAACRRTGGDRDARTRSALRFSLPISISIPRIGIPFHRRWQAFTWKKRGSGEFEIERLSPAIESMPSLGELPEAFRKEFFGCLDYAALGIKLG